MGIKYLLQLLFQFLILIIDDNMKSMAIYSIFCSFLRIGEFRNGSINPPVVFIYRNVFAVESGDQ
jgi:hypothetical protein